MVVQQYKSHRNAAHPRPCEPEQSRTHAMLPERYAMLPERYAMLPERYAMFPKRYAMLPERYAMFPRDHVPKRLRHGEVSS